jgi:hypothetical protein
MKGRYKAKVVARHEDIWGSRGIAPPFLTSALDGDDQSASRPYRFTPGTHWMGGWLSPRVGLNTEFVWKD